eukprot:3578543-Pleurochrysis_carterae.AAC.1
MHACAHRACAHLPARSGGERGAHARPQPVRPADGACARQSARARAPCSMRKIACVRTCVPVGPIKRRASACSVLHAHAR